MGDGVNSEFERFVEERRLVRARISRGTILKEMEAAQTDLQDARDSSERRKFK